MTIYEAVVTGTSCIDEALKLTMEVSTCLRRYTGGCVELWTGSVPAMHT